MTQDSPEPPATPTKVIYSYNVQTQTKALQEREGKKKKSLASRIMLPFDKQMH